MKEKNVDFQWVGCVDKTEASIWMKNQSVESKICSWYSSLSWKESLCGCHKKHTLTQGEFDIECVWMCVHAILRQLVRKPQKVQETGNGREREKSEWGWVDRKSYLGQLCINRRTFICLEKCTESKISAPVFLSASISVISLWAKVKPAYQLLKCRWYRSGFASNVNDTFVTLRRPQVSISDKNWCPLQWINAERKVQCANELLATGGHACIRAKNYS